MTVTVQEGQGIIDIVLQSFGELDYLVQVSNDNGIAISEALTVKQQLVINNEGLGNQKIKDFFTLNNIKPNNDFEDIQKSVNFVFDGNEENFVFDGDGENFVLD